MNRIKKFFGICLLVLITSSLIFSAAAEQAGSISGTDMQILDILGIVNPEEETAEYVTRGELARYMARLSNKNESVSKVKYFYDVTEETALSSYINAAYEAGIMKGHENGLFVPEDNITYAQAVTCIMRVLGYSEIADFNGGYVKGFMEQAAEGKIFELKKGNDEVLTHNEMQSLLYDALSAEIVGKNIDSGMPQYITDTDITLIEQYFDTAIVEGRILAYGSVGVDGRTTTTPESVMILNEEGENLYSCEYEMMSNFVGYTGDIYIRDEDTVICFEPDYKKTEEISLDWYDIQEVSKKLDYLSYRDGKKLEVLEFSDETVFVYNGKMLYEITADDVNVKNGTVKAVDLDSDDVADIVYINEYKAYIVDSLNTSTGVVLDKCERVTVNLNLEDSYYKTTIYKNGRQVYLTSVKEWDVLLVADSKPENGKVKRTVIISSSVTKGTVNKVTDEAITIAGDEYRVVDGIDFSYVNAGDFYIVGINDRGDICCIIKNSGFDKNYAYAINCNINEDTDRATIKLLTEESQYVLYTFSDKARLNGIRTDHKDIVSHFAPEGKMKNQLISYELNKDGEIYEIHSAGEAKEPSKDQKDELVLNLFTDGKYRYKSAPASIDGRYLIGKDTKVFIISYEGTELNEEVSCCVDKSKVTIEDAAYPYIYIYDSGINCVAGVAVIEGSTATTATDKIQIAVVDKISNVYDESKGEVVKVADVLIRGVKQSYPIANTLKNTEALKKGDVAAIGVSDGVLANFSLMYTEKKEAAHDALVAAGHRILFGDAKYDSPSRYGMPSDMESTYYCEVVEKTYFADNSYAITVKCFGEDNYLVFLTDASSRFYIYDAEENEIKCSDYTGVEIGSRAFVNSRFGYMRDIVLFGE